MRSMAPTVTHAAAAAAGLPSACYPDQAIMPVAILCLVASWACTDLECAAVPQVHKAVCLAHSLAMQGVPVQPGLHSALLSTCVAMGAWEQAIMCCVAVHATQVRYVAARGGALGWGCCKCWCCMRVLHQALHASYRSAAVGHLSSL